MLLSQSRSTRLSGTRSRYLQAAVSRDVTCSIGFVRYPFFENADQFFDLKEHVDLSDMAMYVSKTTGRDRWNELKATRTPTDKIDQSMYLNSPEYGLKRGYYVLRDRNGEHTSISDK